MNYIKHNKVFTILLITLLSINISLFYLMLFPNTQSSFSYNENTSTSTAISSFSGNFSDTRRAVELSWNLTTGNKRLEKLELYQNDALLRDVTNSYSVSLPLDEYDLLTGNNEFLLRATFDDTTVLEKNVYVYVNEAYAFEVSEQNASDRTILTLHYYYDKRRSVSNPTMRIDSNVISGNFVSSDQISENGNTVEMEVVYELVYGSAPRGSYTVLTTFMFTDYNLSYDYTSSFQIATQEVSEEEETPSDTTTTEEEENNGESTGNESDTETNTGTDSES